MNLCPAVGQNSLKKKHSAQTSQKMAGRAAQTSGSLWPWIKKTDSHGKDIFSCGLLQTNSISSTLVAHPRDREKRSSPKIRTAINDRQNGVFGSYLRYRHSF